MRQVSIYDLKNRLAEIISEVAEGEEVVIVRYRKPVARLSPAERKYLHMGSRFGQGELKPALKGQTKGRFLEILAEDRSGGSSD